MAWDFASRLSEFSSRLLVVIGATEEEDLQRLYEVLAERPIIDLTLLVVLPVDAPRISQPENPAVKMEIWDGTIEAFTQTLLESAIPSSGEIPQWTIRVGKRAVKLSDRDVARVRENFSILTEKMLIPPEGFTIDDLHAFFAGSLENWRAYGGIGLPVERDYRTHTNESLFQVVLNALKKPKENELAFVYHIELPCETGSGATTLLRDVAFRCAREVPYPRFSS